MSKIFNLFLIIIFCFSCSLNKNSKFWTKEKIKEIEENEKLKHEKFAEENNVSLDEDEPAF